MIMCVTHDMYEFMSANTSRRALSSFLSCARCPSLARARTHVCNVGDGWRTAGADEGHGQQQQRTIPIMRHARCAILYAMCSL